MSCIATWSFGLEAVRVAGQLIDKGTNCIEAVERAINSVEDDPTTGIYYVGRGCYPNSKGIVQLDAGIMRGCDFAIGAVCALEGYACPISVARHIMEHSPHNVLVGPGATDYANRNGFVLEMNDALLVPETKRAYEDYLTNQYSPLENDSSHDTLSVLCLDLQGEIVAGVSTSGPPFKLPGRVGDSPLPGCGYYADSKIGAAAATGDGEKLMQFSPSFQVVQLMRQGCTPQEACDTVLKNIIAIKGSWFEAALIAIDCKGNTGASSTVRKFTDTRTGEVYDGFPYAVWTRGEDPVIKTRPSLIPE